MEEKNNPKKEITLDDLALMVAKGFDEVNEKMEEGFKEVRLDIKVLKTDVEVLKTDMGEVKETLGNIQADLNKKVDKIDHNTLTYRVEKLEKKFI